MKFVSEPCALEVQHLSIHAGGIQAGRCLIASLDMRCEPGERWVVLGPNGAGKSSLLATLAGLLPAGDAGLRIGGRLFKDVALNQLARQRAWCPSFWLDPFPVSGWETVACAIAATQPELSADVTRDAAVYWLEQFDVAGFCDTDVRTLSGGERQRVAIATACAQAAPILLLDEPSAHLDWAHQSILLTRLREWAERGGTVMTALHDLNLAWALASHALLLDGRGGVRAGRRDEVMQAELLSAAYRVPVIVGEDAGVRNFRVSLA